MFSPDMMRQAQEMMGKMTPEQMQQMTEMASRMDPNMIRTMSQSMGQGGVGVPSEEEMKKAQEEMKNMTPDQLKSKMNASNKMVNDKQSYLTAGTRDLKEQGNKCVQEKNYAAGKAKYEEAIKALESSGATDAVLLESCKLNIALCQLRLEEFAACVTTCDDILNVAGKPMVKALYRRGVACCNLPERLREGYVCLKRSNLLSPNDEAIETEFKKQRARALELALDLDDADREAERANGTEPSAGQYSSQNSTLAQTPPAQTRATSSSSMPTPSPDAVKDMLKDQNAMKQASSMMKDLTPEQLASMTGQSKEQCETVKDAMKQMEDNPQMMDQMSQMMQNMSAEDMENMMQMRGQMGAPGSGGVPAGAKEMINNPEMVKTAETFFKSMSPDMLKSTMKSQGVEMSDTHAKLMTKFVPIIMALYRYFLHLKRIFFAYQRYIIAFIILCIGLYFM